jgi:pimeloyl-[acyl-carrier protein] synthase
MATPLAGPGIGERYDLLADSFFADPVPVLRHMQQHAPVYWSPRLGTWVVTRHRDVAWVVQDPAFSVDRGGSISRCHDPSVAAELAWCTEYTLRWMVFADPPRHTRLRAAVHRAFTRSRVERLRPIAIAATRAALARVLPAGAMELIADLAVPVPAQVTAALLGVPAEDGELLKAWTADMFALLGAGVASADVVRAAHRSMRASRDYFAAAVAERRRAPRGDLLSDVVRDADGAGLDEEELIGLCVTLLAGAYETTAYVIGNGVLALLTHPRELARLRAEPGLLDNAVEELFRFDGPALSVVRRARVDVALGDAVIRAGQNVYCMLGAANRDPERFADADRLDVARSDPRHLGLGHGIHFCLGAALSRIETVEVLRAILELGELRIDRDALGGGVPTFTSNLAIRGLRNLPLRFRPDHRAVTAPSARR